MNLSDSESFVIIGTKVGLMYFFTLDFRIYGAFFLKGMTSGPPLKVLKVSSDCLLCCSVPIWLYVLTVKSYGQKLKKKIPFFRQFSTLNKWRSKFFSGLWFFSTIHEWGFRTFFCILDCNKYKNMKLIWKPWKRYCGLNLTSLFMNLCFWVKGLKMNQGISGLSGKRKSTKNDTERSTKMR